MDKSLCINFLKKIRADFKLNQSDMAELLNSSTRTYQRIEAGESELSANQLLRLLKKFNSELFISYLNILSMGNSNVVYTNSLSKNLLSNELKTTELVSPVLGEGPANESSNSSRSTKDPLIGYWEWNINTHETYWSDEMYQLYGFERQQPVSPKMVGDKIFEEDRQAINDGMHELTQNNISYVNRHRVHVDESRYYIVNATGELINVNNDPVVVGSVKAYLIQR